MTLDKITKEELAENKPNPLLFERSVHGTFGDIDAFISHSWHDPSDDKWDGIQIWREQFKMKYGREPRVWFDKCCIDQLSIDDSLMCLPVHLAACKKFLMIAGSTYTSRIWCILEIFVFLAAVNDISRLECIPLQVTPENVETKVVDEGVKEKAILDSFRAFTINECKCYSSDTRDKLLSIIEAGCGTLDDFDDLVHGIELRFFDKNASPRSTVSRMATIMSPGLRRTRSAFGDVDHSSPSPRGGQHSPEFVSTSSLPEDVELPRTRVADEEPLQECPKEDSSLYVSERRISL